MKSSTQLPHNFTLDDVLMEEIKNALKSKGFMINTYQTILMITRLKKKF